MLPGASIEYIRNAMMLKDILGLAAAVATTAEDYNALLALKLLDTVLDFVQGNIDRPLDAALSELPLAAYVYEECTLM